jgi:methyl-accepting chemotaxis protein
MSIGKQLYKGFGIILAMFFVLLMVDVTALWKARSASDEAAATLEAKGITEQVRSQIMQNRLNLNNFLLSGDPRDEDKVNRGFGELADALKKGESQNGNDLLRTALIQVESTEASWSDNFAKPLLAKRHQVDSGDATVSDLQIFYLQKDPASWLTKSSAVLDQVNTDMVKAQSESQGLAKRASTISLVILVLGTLGAIGFGAYSALKTAKSITEPLQHLITVAQEIGNSGDLDQNIDIHRHD